MFQKNAKTWKKLQESYSALRKLCFNEKEDLEILVLFRNVSELIIY